MSIIFFNPKNDQKKGVYSLKKEAHSVKHGLKCVSGNLLFRLNDPELTDEPDDFYYLSIVKTGSYPKQTYWEMELREVNVTRYICPLREGGSLPALAEADDGFKYVVKFRGAGHGTKMLIAELIGGSVAQMLGFRVPEMVFIHLDEAFGRTEGDEEIQDLLKASLGQNLGLHFLSGAFTFDPVAVSIDSKTASRIVWLDAFLTNVDRTVQNTNMLTWHKELWLIDHGASLLFHHSWDNWKEQAVSPFSFIRNHVLLPYASELEGVDKEFREILTDGKIDRIVDLIPENWLHWTLEGETPEDLRNVYRNFLKERLTHSEIFVKEAQHARETLV